ncbi:protein FAM186A-like isoform X13 [Cottoperca gobio]|uniref:Protein FAM186A-like isoform X13 n=1 Tax=Cottoperca gobio TaxID=56716 RepID=A0A6J2QNE0_COTGO|nr:protein FAM186A-like isoform X13 [Cottoperca gobio]
MACGVHLGIFLLCFIQAEHVRCLWASQAQKQNDNTYVGFSQQQRGFGHYPQNQVRQASPSSARSSSLSAQSAVIGGSSRRLNQVNAQKSPTGHIFGLSSSIVSGSSMSKYDQSSKTPVYSPAMQSSTLFSESAPVPHKSPPRTKTSSSAMGKRVSKEFKSSTFSKPHAGLQPRRHKLSSTKQIPSSTNSLQASWNREGNLHASGSGSAGTSGKLFAPTKTHNIPQRFGGAIIRRLKNPVNQIMSVGKPQRKASQQTYVPPQRKASQQTYVPPQRKASQLAYVPPQRKASQQAYVPPQRKASQQAYVPPQRKASQQTYVPPQRKASQQTYVPPQRKASQQAYVPPQRQSSQQAYVPPQRQSSQQAYVPPQRKASQQAYVPPQRKASQQAYVPPQRKASQQAYVPPQRQSSQQAYVPPQQAYIPPQRQSSQQAYVPPQRQSSQQAYVPPQRQSSQQAYVPPQQAYIPPQRQSSQQSYVPPQRQSSQQSYVPPQRQSSQQAYVPPQRQAAPYKPLAQSVHPESKWLKV